MIQNVQDLLNDTGDGVTSFQRAYLDGNIGNLKITAGRYNDTVADGNLYDNRVDGIKATIGKDVKLTAAYGKLTNSDSDKALGGKYWRVALNGDIGNLDLEANYMAARNLQPITEGLNPASGAMGMKGEDKIWTVGAKYKADNWNLGATYLKGNNDTVKNYKGSQSGYVFGIGFMGAKASDPGSFGFNARYYNQGASTVIAHTMCGSSNMFPWEGFKGFKVGANYTVAKNMVATVGYYDLKGKKNNASAKTLWSQFVVTF